MRLRLAMLAAAVAALSGASFATVGAHASDTLTVTVNGTVDTACHMGSPGSSTLNVGTLANLSDGTLAPIAPQNTSITGTWCNTGSEIGILATPLVAQGFSGAPPSGFTKAVNYTASASGWTPTAATFTTSGDTSGGGNGTSPGTQTISDPDAQTITVAVSNFTTPAAGNRLVADPNYSGTITITVQPTAAGP